VPTRLATRVLLIGWDAADWKVIRPLLAAGHMPVLRRFLAEGVSGNIATLEPVLSPILWTSIATGKRPDKHGILGFLEPDPGAHSVAGARPVSSTSRKCKAVWNILSQNGISSNVVSWFASHPAEPVRGACVTNQLATRAPASDQPWPVPRGSVHPPDLEEPLGEMRIRPRELGQAELQPFVPYIADIDQTKDRRLAVLATLLAGCATTHNVATWLLEHRPAEFTAVYYQAIDLFCHAFMDYHPPKLERVSQEDFEIYQQVITGCYRYHDMMLGRLLDLAGEDTTVILLSDHGFHSDHLRPRVASAMTAPASWHRPFGVFAMKGPGVRRGEQVYGATLLDVTPTVLTLFGLPIGADMDGRPLRQAFVEAPKDERVLSWDAIEGPHDPGLHDPGEHADPAEAAEAIKQLVALGYVDPPDPSRQKTAERTTQDNRYNLAVSLLGSGRYDEARPILEELHRAQPESPRVIQALARCAYLMGDMAACRAVLGQIKSPDENHPAAHLVRGAILLGEGKHEEAAEHFRRGEALAPESPETHLLLGQAYTKMKRWPEAERAIRRALTIDSDNARAHDALASVLLRQQRFEEAAESALAAVELLHHMPTAHFRLGVALARTGRVREALPAFETCLAMRPQSPLTHRCLAAAYEHLGDDDNARKHRRAAVDLSNAQVLQNAGARGLL
jgi:predicted AlkP superfamily phosphohydrolase/phosphomutase/Flp pilus assembly protein TadD